MNLVQLPSNQNTQPSAFPKWVLHRIACYLGGRGLSFGDPIVPHLAKAPSKTSINVDVMITPSVDIVDANLPMLTDGQFDHAFMGPRLEIMDSPENLMREIVGKVKVGGHLTVVQKINDPAAKHKFDTASVHKLVGGLNRWKQKAGYERDGLTVQVFKKLHGKKGVDPMAVRTPKGHACICRYGALGDMIMITPLIKKLHEDGFKVTMNISPYALPIIENNPYIYNLVIQEREMIPNPELGEYWKEWAGDYERYINLSESLEGRFLKVEGRRDFYTPKEWRIKTGEHNYYDATMRLGGYPEETGSRGELFFTNSEKRNAERFFNDHKGKFIVIWANNGSSHHKLYPSQELVIEDFLFNHSDAIVITVGDGVSKLSFEHQRLINMIGKWSIRESLIAVKYANLIIGPETMLTNAGGSLGTPTITMLSHSTHEALCKHWGANDYCLAPDQELAPCYPCFQLHYTKESCPLKRMVNSQTGEVIAEAPACALDAITPARLLARIDEVYTKCFASKNLAVAV